ncbi:hypothetical protein NRS6185_03762 [Bacillus subtilis]|uniref:hypothetical protein n=1 Tax=Bacillus subtilis TaxID=1423 RepID=UPI001B94164C|nr:hypothetical protein [Bacillus subtilis]CAF1897040.1 hypothetical protein NRS6185_03762 [Bacillus subtilis]
MIKTAAGLVNSINPVRKAFLITMSKIDECLVLLGGLIDEYKAKLKRHSRFNPARGYSVG